MNTFCGLDFGTSNSTVGICLEGISQLVPLEAHKPTLRSAIFCNAEHKTWEFGQQGINHYLEGAPGRLMMALKSVLGSSLLQDETIIFNESISYADILKHFMKHIKTQAELKLQQELTHVVLGRPVHFHDHDADKDREAQNTLEVIALALGFKEVSFQYEPIAAALTYETTIKKQQLALIIDMGGGTSDFTVIKLTPNNYVSDRSKDVLANTGIHIAGTDFDKKLSLHTVMPLLGLGSFLKGSSSDIEFPSSYFHALTTWHTLSGLYERKTLSHIRSLQQRARDEMLIERLCQVIHKRAGHRILNSVEIAKQQLSDINSVDLDLSYIEDDLMTSVSRITLSQIINELLSKILETIHTTIKLANIRYEDIDAIFYTGGSTRIPVIREKITSLFKNAEVIEGDAFGSVGLGLTIDAKRKYGESKL